MGLEDKGRRGSSYILVTRCQALGLGGRRNGLNIWKYIPSPRSPALEAGAKKLSRPFKWHKTGNYARQRQSIWWTFLASFLQSWVLNWKRFCFVSHPSRVSLLSITPSPCRMLLIRPALLAISSRSLIKKNHLQNPLFIVQLWRKGALPFLSFTPSFFMIRKVFLFFWWGSCWRFSLNWQIKRERKRRRGWVMKRPTFTKDLGATW